MEINGDRGKGNTNTLPRTNQLKKWCFTFNNYEQSDIDVLETKFKEICVKYIFQEECGTKDTKHLQGAIWLKKKMRFQEFGLSKKIHWEKMISEEGSLNYCQKEDTRTGRIITNIKLKKPIKIISDLKIWQKKIYDIFLEEPDERSIYWFYESEGNVGKSAIVKYLLVKHKGEVCFLTGGKQSDIINVVFNDDFENMKACVFDLARCNEGHISYSAIESIKNGLICNTKYEGGYAVFNSPHVFIFANFPPESPKKLSQDRWRIYKIKNEDIILKSIEEY